jgi:glutamate synthase domain-containing protein 1
MNEERMKILEMVEEQKISVEQAIQLLEALKERGGNHAHFHKMRQQNKAEFEAKLQKFAENIDSFAKDFGGRMEDAFKDMEPKIKTATKTVVERTAEIVNDISRAINEKIDASECRDNQCCCEEDCCCEEKPEEKHENKPEDNEPKEN